jgi:hypothetical protein
MQAELHVPGEMDPERAARLEEKQRQLETVHDRHDNLVCCPCFLHYLQILSHAPQVREMFHMEHFTMMVLYDPVVSLLISWE